MSAMNSLVDLTRVRQSTRHDRSQSFNEFEQKPCGVATELRLISVNDVEETFHVAVLIHTHYETSSIVPDKTKIDEFIRDDSYSGFCPSIVMINTVGQQYGDWEITHRVNRHSGVVWTSFRNTFIINESLELQSFPFDRQLFRVGFKSADAALGVWDLDVGVLDYPESDNPLDAYAPFLVSCELNTWSMSGITVGVASEDPDPVSLTAAEMEITILCERDAKYFLWNFISILSGIVCAQGANIAVDPANSGERLGLSLTLLLTAVAFKNVLSSTLPRVGYSTLMDKFVSLSFAWLLAGTAFAAAMSPRVQCMRASLTMGDSVACMNSLRTDPALKSSLVTMDTYFQVAYVVIWVAVTFVIALLCYFPSWVRPSWKYVIDNQVGDIDSMIKRATYVQDLDGEHEGSFRKPGAMGAAAEAEIEM